MKRDYRSRWGWGVPVTNPDMAKETTGKNAIGEQEVGNQDNEILATENKIPIPIHNVPIRFMDDPLQ